MTQFPPREAILCIALGTSTFVAERYNLVRQSEELRENLKQNLPSEQDVGLIVVSPMKRTLQTALIALDWLIDKGVRIHANADWQGRPI